MSSEHVVRGLFMAADGNGAYRFFVDLLDGPEGSTFAGPATTVSMSAEPPAEHLGTHWGNLHLRYRLVEMVPSDQPGIMRARYRLQRWQGWRKRSGTSFSSWEAVEGALGDTKTQAFQLLMRLSELNPGNGFGEFAYLILEEGEKPPVDGPSGGALHRQHRCSERGAYKTRVMRPGRPG